MILWIAGFLITFATYLYLRYPFNYWKKLNIPSPPPIPFLGHISDFITGKRHFVFSFDDAYKYFPNENMVGILELSSPNLIIRNPKLAHDILVKDFNYFHDRGMHVDEKLDPLNANLVNLAGNRWKTTRSKLMPAFSSGKLKQMYPLMQDCLQELNEFFDREADKGSTDVREAMAKFSTDIIGRCAFGLDFNTLKDPNSEFRKIGKKIFTLTYKVFIRICLRLINPKLLEWIRIKSTSEEVEHFFFNLLDDTLRYRQKESGVRNDFLQLMINIQEQEKEKGIEEENLFSDTLLVANMFVFFAGGFETTATTLSYCLYELALNPDVQERVREEVNRVKKNHANKLDYDSLNELNYLECVILETLRKYPPVPLNTRTCTETYKIPDTSITLQKKQRVTIPTYSFHHDPKYFPDPERFYPERFKENYEKLAYLPFGDGPRICIGLRLAKLEMKSCLAEILNNYNFSICDKTPIPIEFKPRSIFFTPKTAITLKVVKI